MDKYTTVEEYIESFPANVQRILQRLRQVIRAAAPGAEEGISYQMPAFRQNGVLVYYAAFKDHISLFPTASGMEAFQQELAPYRTSKGTVQFPLDRPLPLGLVRRIVEFRVKENVGNASQRGAARSRRSVR